MERSNASMGFLSPFRVGENPLDQDSRRIRNWLIALLVVGIAARVARYILRFPLWEDECFLSFNLIDRSFAGLAGPLDYLQVAPMLFLWIQKAVVSVIGFSELSLRLFPFLCSLLSLALFTHLARTLLQGTAMVLAVGIFAVAYPAIRYAVEAKQYGVDLAVSLVIITLVVQWLQDRRTIWIWGLAAFTPVAVLLSFPSVFIAGAASLVLIPSLRLANGRMNLLAWSTMNAAMFSAFAFSQWLASGSHQVVTPFMNSFWEESFFPVHLPSKIPFWLLQTFTGDALAFPFGSSNGGSAFTFLLCLIGLIALWRGGRRSWCIALLLPVMLHLVASALQRYPLGGHVKFSMYLLPMVCIFAGIGGAVFLQIYPANRPRRLATSISFALLLAIGLGIAARDVIHPYKTFSDARARSFAQWLWFDLPHAGEVACLYTDMDTNFSPSTFGDLSWSAMYLVNQRITSPRLRNNQDIDQNKITGDHPLYVVEFRDGSKPYDESAQLHWLSEMAGKYDLSGQQAFPMTRYDKRERRLIQMDQILLYRFVPKS